MGTQAKRKISPLGLGLGLGTVWGVSLLITTWVSYYTGYAELFLNTMAGSIYPGYSITLPGSFVGLLYGYIDGILGGLVIGWIHNRFVKE
jgi:hypothetical protein